MLTAAVLAVFFMFIHLYVTYMMKGIMMAHMGSGGVSYPAAASVPLSNVSGDNSAGNQTSSGEPYPAMDVLTCNVSTYTPPYSSPLSPAPVSSSPEKTDGSRLIAQFVGIPPRKRGSGGV